MKATATEKKYFPWPYETFVEQLIASVQRLHWQDCHIKNSMLTARIREKRRLGDIVCRLDFTVTANFVKRGEGVDLLLTVCEEHNTWSVNDCKKKCQTLLTHLGDPLTPRRHNLAELIKT